MDNIRLQENKLMFTKFSDGSMGRFDFRGDDSNNYELYYQLGEGKSYSDMEVFKSSKVIGSLNDINEELLRFEIVAEIIEQTDQRIISR